MSLGCTRPVSREQSTSAYKCYFLHWLLGYYVKQIAVTFKSGKTHFLLEKTWVEYETDTSFNQIDRNFVFLQVSSQVRRSEIKVKMR